MLLLSFLGNWCTSIFSLFELYNIAWPSQQQLSSCLNNCCLLFANNDRLMMQPECWINHFVAHYCILGNFCTYFRDIVVQFAILLIFFYFCNCFTVIPLQVASVPFVVRVLMQVVCCFSLAHCNVMKLLLLFLCQLVWKLTPFSGDTCSLSVVNYLFVASLTLTWYKILHFGQIFFRIPTLSWKYFKVQEYFFNFQKAVKEASLLKLVLEW